MIRKLRNHMVEIELKSKLTINNPFWSVELKAVFTHEKGEIKQLVHGFYDGKDEAGEDVFKLRWTPGLSGAWTVDITVFPAVEEWNKVLTIEVKEDEVGKRGFLRAREGQKWGLRFDNGEPFYLLGDTMYNLFGGYYCGTDVESILRYRKSQGVNYVRSRIQVSPFLPAVEGGWQTKDCWLWGGSAQSPDFTRFNLDYFRAVDEVLSMAADLEIGLEIVLEGWLTEFPFNDRGKFIPEYEQLWLKYIISRIASYPSVYLWCPANEYEFYPNGDIKYHPEADHWLRRISALIKELDPYKHPIGVHNWEQKLPVNERFGDCKDIDVYLVQSDWCYELEKYDWKKEASLCMRLELQVKFHAQDSGKVVICDEFGYEKAEGCFTFPAHDLLDHHHTRRGQWRAAFSGFPIVHGFNNTWGPYLRIDKDAIGAGYLIHLFRFMTEEIKFYEMRSAQELIKTSTGEGEEGTLPLCLANASLRVVSVYFPTTGECSLAFPKEQGYSVAWINPRNGEKKECGSCIPETFSTPGSNEGSEAYGDDWILLLRTCNL